MALFKSKQEREAERRLAARRAQKSLERSIKKLEAQRQRYHLLGQAAARNGSRDKVKMIALAIQRSHVFERQIEQARVTLELFETQRGIAQTKGAFSEAMRACSGALMGANVMGDLAKLEVGREQAAVDREEIEILAEAMMDAGGSYEEPGEAEDLSAIEAAMGGVPRADKAADAREAAKAAEADAKAAPAPAKPRAAEEQEEDDIDRDLKNLARELNMGA